SHPYPTGSVVGVCVLPEPLPNAPRTVRCGHYVHEILEHAGLCCDRMELEKLPAQLDRLRLLVTVGEASWPEDVRRRVAAWVEAGGAWLSTGGLCGMGELLGVEALPPAFALWGGALPVLGEGFLDARGSSHPVL